MAVVTLDAISKTCPDGADVLRDVSLTLVPGDLCCVTGASGAGKTTLLNIVGLAEEPSLGRLTLFDADAVAADRATRAALRRRIGIVFQDLRLLDHLSARDNMALPLRISGLPEGEIHDHVSELAGWLGIRDLVEARPPALSMNARRRVAIGRAIVGRPDLLIADEPAGGVDGEAVPMLVRLFEQLNSVGTTVLIATRDLSLARQFDGRRVHLEGGVLVDAGADTRP